MTSVKFDLSACLSRFYVKDAAGMPTTTPLYEAWFHWETGKYQMADYITASVYAIHAAELVATVLVVRDRIAVNKCNNKKVKIAHSRFPSVGFRS